MQLGENCLELSLVLILVFLRSPLIFDCVVGERASVRHRGLWSFVLRVCGRRAESEASDHTG